MTDHEDITRFVRERCALLGLDLVQPFEVGAYNAEVDAPYHLPTFGRTTTLGLLIGNTRALWPRFIEALRARPEMLEGAHPLDRYAAESVDAALGGLSVRWEARGAHEAPPRRVAMQQLAQTSGLAWLSPSHLNVHPVYGPWLAFRAAAVIDVDGPPASPSPRTCEACAERCAPAFAYALQQIDDPIEAHEDIARHWSLWLAVRDACPIGREHRYDDDQLRYHYTKDRGILRRLAEEKAPR